MSETRSETRIDRDAVATMLRVEGLAVAEERLDELASLLSAADAAASRLHAAAEYIPLDEALERFDPAWPAGGDGRG